MRSSTLLAVLVVALTACSDDADRLMDPVRSIARADNVPARTAEPATSWVHRSDVEVWNESAELDSTFLVGLKAPGQPRGIWEATILVDRREAEDFKRALAAQPGVELVRADPVVPIVLLRISDFSTLAAIRRLPFVDYVEPHHGRRRAPSRQEAAAVSRPTLVAPRFSESGSSSPGCSNPDVYTEYGGYTALGDPYSWSYTERYNNIVGAWRRSQGDNVRIALIDTGVDSEQPQLTSRFGFTSDATWSRQIWYEWVRPSGRSPAWRDDCGHGTRMAGVIAAPHDGQNTVGTAWKADLISIRTDDDVNMRLSESEVADAIHKAMDPWRPAHVIVFAFWSDDDNWVTSLADVIRYYYYRTDSTGRRNGPLFVGAAGTSSAWDPFVNWNVVFPAEMEEVIAVSGVNSNRILDDESHYGPEVDLAGYTPQMTVGVPGVHYQSALLTSIRGSSGPTASVGAIAALVWSRYPHMTNVEVRQRLIWAALRPQERRSDDGYGPVNAYKAVGGFSGLAIHGPEFVPPYTTFAVEAVSSGDGPFTYRWNNGATTKRTSYRSTTAGYTVPVRVDVTDTFEGVTRTAYLNVAVQSKPSPNTCDPNVEFCPK
ncbi:MAG TPA: S8/S53 family peptidase [Longimicrobium sp.]|jgi:hypothetical protein|uniref:S8 family peptidase n=1 Tax=Longimicrobium sp. TaxID=2029185 RepID=UPI002EDAFF4D